MKRKAKIAVFGFTSSLISAKTGINYPDLEPGNEFWNPVWIPGSCYKSLPSMIIDAFTVKSVTIKCLP